MSSLLQKLREATGHSLEDIPRNSKLGGALSKSGVQRTKEYDRIAGLPRRALDLSAVPDLTPVFLREDEGARVLCTGCRYCEKGPPKLRPIQSAALLEAEACNGIFGAMGVSAGKALTSLLLADAIPRVRKAVLLVQPDLREKLVSFDIPTLSRHFVLPLDRLSVVSYSTLSVASGAETLEKLRPDLIIADECHNLRLRTSARTKRFLRYMRENPQTRFAGLSGSITKRNLRDYAHLIELALRAGSPLPLSWREMADWDDVLGEDGEGKIAPGALLRFYFETLRGKPKEEVDEEVRRVLEVGSDDDPKAQEEARSYARRGFRARLVETRGVVATAESAEDMSLVLRRRVPIVPVAVERALATLRATWRIDREEIEDPMAFARYARQLAAGFYQRWVWPNGEPGPEDLEWLEARAEIHKAMREKLKQSRKGLDSPLLLALAAERAAARRRGEQPKTSGPEWDCAAWEPWKAIRDLWKPHPPTEVVWIDRFLVEDAIEWARAREREGGGIIWYSHDAIGKEIARAGGFPLFAGGDAAALVEAAERRYTGQRLAKDDPESPRVVLSHPVIVVSANAHRTGKDLQAWSRNLFTPGFGPNPEWWEQILGRTHRSGQRAHEVAGDLYLHTEELEETMREAERAARYVEETTGGRQKLLLATKVGW